MSNRKILSLIICIFFIILNFNAPVVGQYGGIGLKVSRPDYQLPENHQYEKLLNSLYISIRLAPRLTIFVDSYLFRDDGKSFDTGLNIPMEASSFSDKATILGPMYYFPLKKSDVSLYGGAGFGWHSLKLGYKNQLVESESSKNYGGHLVFGLSYDLKKIPALVLAETRYSQIFLKDDASAFHFSPSILHRSGSIQMLTFSLGILVYFF